MRQGEKVNARIQSLDERLARLRVEKSRLLARASQAERKRDTRRKILIGGAVLAAVDHEGMPPIRSKLELLHWLDARLARPHDRAVFDLPHAEGNGPSSANGDISKSPSGDATVKEAGEDSTAKAARMRP